MDVKEKTSKMIETHRGAVKSGASAARNRVVAWVKEPGSTKESGVRVMWLGVLGFMWVMCLVYSPGFTLGVTLVGGFVVVLKLGVKRDAAPARPVENPVPTPVKEPDPAPVEEVIPASVEDEFWVKHTPSEAPTVSLAKLPSLTEGDGDLGEEPTVPLRKKAPVAIETPQVSAVRDSETPVGTPGTGEEVTDHDVNVDHVGIFPEANGASEGQIEAESVQVNDVSQPWDTPVEQATEDVTESEISTDEDEEPSEDFAGLLLKLADKGLSIREIAEATGRKRSTVGRMLKKAKERREAEEIATTAVRAKTRHEELVDVAHKAAKTRETPEGTPVPQVILPGAWYGEDGHAQEVKFTEDAVILGADRTQEEAVSVLDFIREAFLGKTETTTGNWSVNLDDGTISGSVPGQQVEFRGFWSETGTVVIRWVSLL